MWRVRLTILLKEGIAMRTFDFSPLFRSTVGFDRMTQLMDAAMTRPDQTDGYPPYNIEKQGDDKYRITLAVAGFGPDDIDITVKENSLIVSGKADTVDKDKAFMHRGIAGRAFERSFQLADHLVVNAADLKNGLLHVDLERIVPEELKPRRIEISNGGPKTIEQKAA
jgi:molecular chaperone IbpA